MIFRENVTDVKREKHKAKLSLSASLLVCPLSLFPSYLPPLFFFFFGLILSDFFLSLYLGYSFRKVSLMFLCLHCDVDFRIMAPQILKQSQTLLARLGKCLLLVLRRWGLLPCRLSDRDDAELSTGHGDIGRVEGASLANLLGTSLPLSPVFLVPCKYLNVAVCSSWALLALWVLLSPSVPCMLIVWFLGCHYLC